jgi:hypothetical protein
MAVGYFEDPVKDAALLAGTISGTIHEHGGVNPTTIIRTDTNWAIHLQWKLTGALVPMICGKWCVHVYLESIGPGPELKLHDAIGPHYIDLNPGGNGEYFSHFDVLKGTVTADHCSTPYKLVAAVTYLTSFGKPGPMAGFVEGPIVQFYDPS